jgi:sugar-phosphatase
MDGTLVDSTEAVHRIWGTFAARFGLEVDDILATSHGVRMSETITRHAPAGTDVDRVAGELSEIELNDHVGVVEVPGAAGFLRSIPQDRWALVTSATRELADVRMRISGLPVPAVVVTAEDVDRGKPEPDPYLLAAERLGVDPADAIVFEDAEAGIRSGLAAGCRVVVVGELTSDVTEGLPRIVDYLEVTAGADGDEIVLSF